MSYNILTVRTAEDVDDGAVYPVLSDASSRYLVEMDSLDGTDIAVLSASHVNVQEAAGGGLRTVVKAGEIKLDLYITDSRFVIACEKWDKGGGWVGSPGTALVLNAVSKARAAARRRGKILVGQIRYPWLMSIGASPKTSWLDSEMVRLQVRHGTESGERYLLLDLTLPKNVDSIDVARDIASRAARYRLAHDESMEAAERSAFEALCTPERLRPEPKKFAFHSMPTAYRVLASTAFPNVH